MSAFDDKNAGVIDWLKLASDLSAVLAERIDLKASLETVARILCGKRDMAAAVVLIGSEDEIRVFDHGFSPRLRAKTVDAFKAGHRLFAPVALESSQAAREYPLWTAAVREGANALFARPLVTSGRPVGEFVWIAKEEGLEPPPEDFLRLLESFLVTAIEREELFRDKAGTARRGETLAKALGEAVVEGAAGGVMVTDLSGVLLLINRPGEDTLGVDAMDTVGLEVAQVNPRLAHLMERGLGVDSSGTTEDFQVNIGKGTETIRVRATGFKVQGLDYVLWHFGDDAENAELRSKISVQASRFSSLLDSTPLGVFCCDDDGRITDYNSVLPGLFKMIGADVSEGDRLYGDDRFEESGIAKAVRTCFERRKPARTYHKVQDEILGTRYFSVQTAPVETDDGRMGVQALVEDTTEHETMRNSLIMSEERYRTFFENAPIGLSEVDLSRARERLLNLPYRGRELLAYLEDHPQEVDTLLGLVRVVAVNPASHYLYGTENFSQLSASFPRLISKERIKELFPALEMIISGNSGCAFETIVTNVAGRRLRVSVNIAVAPGHEKDLAKVLMSAVDTSKLREMEEELKNSEDMLRTVFEAMGSGVLVTDNSGRILLANPSARRTLAVDPSVDLGGVGIENIVKGATSLLRDSAPGEQQQAVLTLEDGSRRTVGFTSAASPRGSQRIIVFRDLTKIIDANRRQQRSEQLAQAGMMAAKLGHEIKNPITSILLGLRTLEKDADLDDNDAQLIRSVLDEVRYLKSLVGNLLDSLRLKDVVPIKGPLSPVVESCVASQNHLALHNGMELVSVKGPSSTQSFLDKEAIGRVLTNLVQNAIEACAKGDRVTVGWRELAEEEVGERFPGFSGEVACLYVEDTGPGMPSEVMANLFVPFTSTKSRGTGLGLSVVREVVMSHGGVIEVVSGVQEKGRGTRFEILLVSGDRPGCLTLSSACNVGNTCEKSEGCPVNQLGAYNACWIVNGRASLHEYGKWNDECLSCEVYKKGALEQYYRRPNGTSRKGM